MEAKLQIPILNADLEPSGKWTSLIMAIGQKPGDDDVGDDSAWIHLGGRGGEWLRIEKRQDKWHIVIGDDKDAICVVDVPEDRKNPILIESTVGKQQVKIHRG